MFFKKKIERVVNPDAKRPDNEPLPLEKGDLPAMLLSAFLVFLPALLLIIGVVLFLAWLFYFRF